MMKAHRPLSDWGAGDLPAPWAEGDRVRLVRPPADPKQLDDMPLGYIGAAGTEDLVVCSAFSIGTGDEWYFRVQMPGITRVSGRLHVVAEGRAAEWSELAGRDDMSCFDLVETSDPDGLVKRNGLLAAGWTPPPKPEPCPACGRSAP